MTKNFNPNEKRLEALEDYYGDLLFFFGDVKEAIERNESNLEAVLLDVLNGKRPVQDFKNELVKTVDFFADYFSEAEAISIDNYVELKPL